ncbi:hypothetical protein P4O66_001904 [Electrophorus voltai]|uniref:G-protein coupled receptors family 1 profile domain-containing protein n=1 Tax=Electrophorus voltai TaxID=2609070 RepID=A0AAD8Z442_9TELE|nr:hypothetical protein P4O66_001904 [Electrophorus voltai]
MWSFLSALSSTPNQIVTMAKNHAALSTNSQLYTEPSYTPFPILLNTTDIQTTHPSTIMSYDAGPILGALILTIVFVIGAPGNLFVIWSILARTRRHSVTTLLILNLAFADGALMVLIPFFIVYLMRRSWIFGLGMCKVLYYLCCANMYASILLISLMSLHRLVAVVWPQRIGAITGRRTVGRVLVVLWFLALALAVPVLAFRTVTPLRKEGYDLKSLVCDCIHHTNTYVMMQYGMETFLGFLLPYGLIVGSYACILRRIRQTKFRRRVRSEKLILTIIITFGILWLPYHIINMMQVAAAFYPDSSPVRTNLHLLCVRPNPAASSLSSLIPRLISLRSHLRAFVSTMGFVSSCINPVLYTLAARVYIQRAGAAFMARLFDATGLDSSSRKGRLCTQNSCDPDRIRMEEEELRDKESESISGSTNGNLKVTSQTLSESTQTRPSSKQEPIQMVAQGFNPPPSTPASAQPHSLSNQIRVAFLVFAFVIDFPVTPVGLEWAV